jgi:hypothetical protein
MYRSLSYIFTNHMYLTAEPGKEKTINTVVSSFILLLFHTASVYLEGQTHIYHPHPP